ncbi:unnamed protein product [Psylliodes chrysocephalus]|uniref:Uncharacterized protein n=1 Tax=Psylliodes chrysocephalus TaxID=3402493 RepID=A0A9P0D7D5_9CUCU|nr:unnamed protein product [Psylliodes chrysocephala]
MVQYKDLKIMTLRKLSYKQPRRKMKKKKSKINSSDDKENADNFSLHSSSSEASLSTLLRKEVEERQEKEEEAFKPVTKKQIEAVVSFVRKASDRAVITTFYFPSQEDITDVMEDDIIFILPKPTIGRRGEVIFSVGFSQNNIQ